MWTLIGKILLNTLLFTMFVIGLFIYPIFWCIYALVRILRGKPLPPFFGATSVPINPGQFDDGIDYFASKEKMHSLAVDLLFPKTLLQSLMWEEGGNPNTNDLLQKAEAGLLPNTTNQSGLGKEGDESRDGYNAADTKLDPTMDATVNTVSTVVAVTQSGIEPEIQQLSSTAENENGNRNLETRTASDSSKPTNILPDTSPTLAPEQDISEVDVHSHVIEPEKPPPAVSVDISRIPNDIIQKYRDMICVICQEQLSSDTSTEDGVYVRKLTCGHIFHDQCIWKWLVNSKSTCPCCNKEL